MGQVAKIGGESGDGEVASDGQGTDRPTARFLARLAFQWLLLPLAAVMAGCWWLLYDWYSVFEHRDDTHFALQKLQGAFDNPILRQTLGVFVLFSVVYAFVLWLLHSGGMSRAGVVAVCVMVFAMGAGCVLLYPVGALDVFNYMVELKLTYHYDQNPYLVTFEAYREDSFARSAFLVDVTLFYGPAWLLVSWIPVAITGFTDVIQTLLGMKVFNLALLAVIAFLVARHHRDDRFRWFAPALVLLNPLVMFEGVVNAHNDVMLTAFLVGAVMALERRSPVAGPLLALSTLVKAYSVVLLPLFIVVALRDRWGWKKIAQTVALTSVAVVVTFAPFWGDGKLVDGLLGGLEESQGMDHVSPYSLAQQYAQSRIAEDDIDPEFVMSRPAFEILPDETRQELWIGFTVAMVAATLALAASAWRGRSAALAAADTLLVMFLASTNLYPWYLIPVVALFALRPERLGIWYVAIATGLGLAYYPLFVYGHFNTGWSRFEVHQFLALFLTLPILIYLVARMLVALRGVLVQRDERRRASRALAQS